MHLDLIVPALAFAGVVALYIHRRYPTMPITPAASAIVDDLAQIKAAIAPYVAAQVAPIQKKLDAANADLSAANDRITALTTDDTDSAAAIKASAADVLASLAVPADDQSQDQQQDQASKTDPLTGQPVVAGQ